MPKEKIIILTTEHNPITGTKIVEKEIEVNAIVMQFNDTKKQKTMRAKATAHIKQR